MKEKNKSLIIISLFFCLMLAAGHAAAHAAIVWAYVENNTVYVEAFFANGTKIQDTKVLVLDEKENILTQGKTDKEGKFQYTPTTNKKQIIVIMAGESHIGDFELTEEDLQKINVK